MRRRKHQRTWKVIPTHWYTPQMPETARTESGGSWELRFPFRSPFEFPRPKSISITHCLPRCLLAEIWIKNIVIKLAQTNTLTGKLTSRPNIVPWND